MSRDNTSDTPAQRRIRFGPAQERPELRNATPKSLLETPKGERTVENLLASLVYGFSV